MANTNYNLLILMTDQQRTQQHFPDWWTKKYMPNLDSLKSTGLTFNNAITNSSRCSSVRSMAWTSTFPPRNGVTTVGENLTNQLPTLGYLLSNGSNAVIPPPGGSITAPINPYYITSYHGKWHLTSAFNNVAGMESPSQDVLNKENAQMESDYGMLNWDAPDAGTSLSNEYTMGGGSYNSAYSKSPQPLERWQNDKRYTEDVKLYLKTIKPNVANGEYFCLVASLVNPHDIWAYNNEDYIKDVYPDYYYYVLYPNAQKPAGIQSTQNNEFFADLLKAFNKHDPTISTWLSSSNYTDNLSTKPVAQTEVRNEYNEALYAPGSNPVTAEDEAVKYIRFYAYLNHIADHFHDEICKELADQNLTDSTVIVRIADHGETGFSHQGIVEKDCNMYNETINVPVVFSNPALWSSAQVSEMPFGLIDLLPTLMEFSGLSPQGDLYMQGSSTDRVSIFQGISWYKYIIDSTQNTAPDQVALFTYNDSSPGAWYIRGIVVAPGTYSVSYPLANGKEEGVSLNLTSDYKFAVYYQNGNMQPYRSSNPTGIQLECYEDYTGSIALENKNEAHNSAYSDWGKDFSSWSPLNQGLFALLTSQMQKADACGPANVSGAITPDGWNSVYTLGD